MRLRVERLRPVAPLALVTGFAMYGQAVYWLSHPTRPDAPLYERIGLAVGAAVTMESIALYVQYHAHDALLKKATATAARLRRASYAVALGIASLNYYHFSDAWHPTPAAVVFALFSASGPWLWGLHTRRVQHLQLLREGQADTSGAVFSAERFRNFPWRTMQARRWSIDYGITDPRIAWESYRVEQHRRKAARAADVVSPVPVDLPPAPEVPELERFEDVVVPDLSQVDERGLSLRWKTAPRAASTTLKQPQKPAARQNRSPFLENPPAKAIELARQHGHVELRREVLRQCGVEISEHEAKELRREHRPTNGHQVMSS